MPFKKEHFADILSLNDVRGAVVVSGGGQILFQRFYTPPTRALTNADFQELISALSSIRELELVFDNIRLYIRQFGDDYLIIVMGRFVHMPMVRLSCNVLIPNLMSDAEKPKGFSRFFKR